MKRLTLLVPFIVLFTIIGFGQRNATVIAQNANLRGTASSSGAVVATLPQGSIVEVFTQRGPWFLVQSAQYAGWMHGDTLQFGTDGSVYSYPRNRPSAPTYVPPVRPTGLYPATIRSSTVAPESQTNMQGGQKPQILDSADPPKIDTANGQAADAKPSDNPPGPATGICADGTLTYSQTSQGACSDHGGLARWYADTALSASGTATPSSSNGTVHVNGYYRKDGTYVRPYTRSAPRKKP